MENARDFGQKIVNLQIIQKTRLQEWTICVREKSAISAKYEAAMQIYARNKGEMTKNIQNKL